MKKIILLFILLNSNLGWAIGNPTDSTAVEKKQQKIAITNLGQLNQVVQQYKTRQQNAGAPFRSFPSLDSYTTATVGGPLDDVADFTKEKLKQWFDNKGRSYYKANISDSKLTRNSPWTKNQLEELINAFKKTDKPYLEFEIRTALDKLPKNPPVKTKDMIRIYKKDVFKITGDGSGNFGEVIQMFK